MNIAVQGWQDLQVAQPIDPKSVIANSSFGADGDFLETDRIGGFAVQKVWSNRQGKCVSLGQMPTPSEVVPIPAMGSPAFCEFISGNYSPHKSLMLAFTRGNSIQNNAIYFLTADNIAPDGLPDFSLKSITLLTDENGVALLSADGPALAYGNNVICIAWIDPSHNINVMISYGNIFFKNHKVLPISSAHSSSLTFAFGKFFMAWDQKEGTDWRPYIHVMSSSDGITWGNKVILQDWTDAPPTISFANGRLFVLYKGIGSDDHLFIRELDSNGNPLQEKKLGDQSNTAPNMIGDDGNFILVWSSKGSPPTIFTMKDSDPFFPNVRGQDHPISFTPNTPALVNFQGTNFIAWTNWELSHHIYLSKLSNFLP